MRLEDKVIANHLKQGYSDYVFEFIRDNIEYLNLNSSILDAGCGHYRNLKLFYELGFKDLHGIDKTLSDNPLKVPLRFIKHDLEDGIPYSDKYFDVVLCNFVMMFIKNSKQEFLVKELLRVTKRFLVLETNRNKEYTQNTFYQDYDFLQIVSWIECIPEFSIVRVRKGKSKEKITVVRREL